MLELPFVGRQQELRLFDEALATVAAGRSATLVVTGEQGSGKTRLLDELSRRAAVQGAAVAVGRAFDADGTPPFWLWRNVVEQLAGPDAAARLFDEAIGSPPAHLAVYHALETKLRALTTRAVTVVSLDDLHWADAASVGFLVFLTRQHLGHRLLVVATWCPEAHAASRPAGADDTGGLAELRLDAAAVRLALAPLAADDLAGWLPPGPTRRAAAARLAELSAGNAFLATEVLRSGDASDTSRQSAVPPSVRAIVHDRLAALDPRVLNAVEAAAVIGRRGATSTLADVLGEPPEEVAAQVRTAIAVGLFDPHDDAAGFRFRHALVRQAVEARVEPARLVRLHVETSRALASRGLADDLWAIAGHLTAAALIAPRWREDALDAWRRAAERAASLGAHADAAQQLGRAVELAAPPDQPQLLVELGTATARSGHPAAALAHFTEAARRSTDPAVIASAALGYEDAYLLVGDVRLETGDPSTELLRRARAAQPPGAAATATLAAALARAAWYSDPSSAPGWLRQADADAAHTDAAGRMATAFARRVLAGGPGDAAKAAAACAELIELAADMGRRDIALDALRQRVLSLVELGDLEQADEEIERFDRLVQHWDEALFLPYAPLLRAMRMMHRGELATARQLNRRVMALSTQLDSVHTAQMALMQRFALARWTGSTRQYPARLLVFAGPTGSAPVWYCAAALAEAESGRLDNARRHLSAALGPRGIGSLPRNEWFLMAAGTAALVCRALGDVERAAVLHRELAPYRHFLLGNVAPIFGPVAQVAGVAAATAGRPTEAAALFEEAERHAERLGSPLWMAEARLAREALDDGTTPPRTDRASLATAATAGDRRAAPGVRLTPREREVLRLISAGRSNQEIAAELCISYRTAKTHVSNILVKLGARDRTTAVALAGPDLPGD